LRENKKKSQNPKSGRNLDDSNPFLQKTTVFFFLIQNKTKKNNHLKSSIKEISLFFATYHEINFQYRENFSSYQNISYQLIK